MRSILFVAGDVSGDIHCAMLAHEVAARHPGWKIVVVGGAKLHEVAQNAENGRILGDTTGCGVIGVGPTLPLLPRVLKLRRTVENFVRREPPDAVVLCDWGAFNGRLLPFLKAQNVPSLYYFPPRSWQRGSTGGLGIVPFVSRVATPFEWSATRLQNAGCAAEWVGHPLLETVRPSCPREELRREFGAFDSDTLIALLPGSRAMELRYIAPHLVESARLLQSRNANRKFRFAVAVPPGAASRVRRYFEDSFVVVEGRAGDLFFACDAAVVKSGTVTLEAAVAGAPMVVVYDVPAVLALQWKITGSSHRVPFVAMPNIILGRMAVRELLGPHCRPQNIVVEVEKLLDDAALRAQMSEDYKEVRRALGAELPFSATARTATILEELIAPGRNPANF